MINFFVTSSKEGKNLSDLMDKIKREYAYNFKQYSKKEFEFSSDYPIDLDIIKEISRENESEIELIFFDTSFGVATKKVLNYGFVASDKSITFTLDTEDKVYQESVVKEVSFKHELKKLIDEIGVENSNLPKKNSTVTIHISMIEDEDFLEWIRKKDTDKFVVKSVDIKSGLLWIENCDFAIKIEDCSLY